MSRFKFRAWDKKSKKIREVGCIVYWTIVDCMHANQIGEIKLVHLVGRNCIEQKDIFVKREQGEFELMQSTGLFDSEGVEIFESDIVEIMAITKGTGERAEMIGSVYFDEFEYVVDTTDDSWPCVSWERIVKVKVVGNTHQNSELIA